MTDTSSVLTTVETDAASVLSALPSVMPLITEVDALFQGIAHGVGGIAKVGATSVNLINLISGLLTAYAAFHAGQAAASTAVAPPAAS